MPFNVLLGRSLPRRVYIPLTGRSRADGKIFVGRRHSLTGDTVIDKKTEMYLAEIDDFPPRFTREDLTRELVSGKIYLVTLAEVFMVSIRSSRSVLIVLLLACLLLPGKIIGAVLCLGADGHIAVEAAHNGRCGTLPLQVFPSIDHCGSCVDVRLSSDDAGHRKLTSVSSLVLKLEAPPLALIPSSLLLSTAPLTAPLVSRRLLPPGTLTFLRTMVLLV